MLKPATPRISTVSSFASHALENNRLCRVVLKSNRLCRGFKRYLRRQRRLAFALARAVQAQFDNTEGVFVWSAGCIRFPRIRIPRSKFSVRHENDALPAISACYAVGRADRIARAGARPEVTDRGQRAGDFLVPVPCQHGDEFVAIGIRRISEQFDRYRLSGSIDVRCCCGVTLDRTLDLRLRQSRSQ